MFYEVTDKNKLAPFYGPQCITGKSTVAQQLKYLIIYTFHWHHWVTKLGFYVPLDTK